MNTYKTLVKIKHTEIPAAIDTLTGEVREHVSVKKTNNIPLGKEVFESKALFRKHYGDSWNFLIEVLTPVEFKIAYRLCEMAEMNTNSLKPIDDTTSKTALAEEFGIHRNYVGRIFNKLFLLGVYGRFEVAKPHLPHGKYWIVNPYLSFAGKLIHSDVAQLFSNTIIHMAFNKLDHNYLLSKCYSMGIKLPNK